MSQNWRNAARDLLGPGRGFPEYNCACPSCGGDRFYYNLDTNKGNCHHGSCSFSVHNFHSLVRKLDKLNRHHVSGPQWEPEESKEDTLLQGAAVPAEEDTYAYNYLTTRGVSHYEMSKVSIWSYPKKRTIVIPVDNVVTGEETPYVRYLDPKSKIRWRGETGFERKEHLFGARYIPPGRRSIILVEGIFDVLSPGLLGGAVATLGASISEELKIYLCYHFNRVFVWRDNDAAGIAYLRLLTKQLTYYGLEVIDVAKHYRMYQGDDKDKKDPGDFRRHSIKVVTLKRDVVGTVKWKKPSKKS